MKINDLLKRYTFHDSLLENIDYDENNNKLILTIDFCLWMQNDFDETQPETAPIKLIFTDIDKYDGLKGDIDSYSILKTSYDNDILTFSLSNDVKYYEISFKTENVILQKS